MVVNEGAGRQAVVMMSAGDDTTLIHNQGLSKEGTHYHGLVNDCIEVCERSCTGGASNSSTIVVV